MSVITAMFLGLIQGLTEFLPVSSSGHLVLVSKFLAWTGATVPSNGAYLSFEIYLHAATLLSVIIYFRKDIIRIILTDKKTMVFLLIASLPAGLVALLFSSELKALHQSSAFVGVALMITGAVLIFNMLAGYERRAFESISLREVLMMGIAQAASIAPGISRSGMTIVAGNVSGVRIEAAFRFSFLMSIPIIFGALILDIITAAPSEETVGFIPTVMGCIVAFASGLGALKILAKAVKNRWFSVFGLYCLAIGVLTLLVSLVS